MLVRGTSERAHQEKEEKIGMTLQCGGITLTTCRLCKSISEKGRSNNRQTDREVEKKPNDFVRNSVQVGDIFRGQWR
jgi:hypothetical protein